MNLSFHAVAHKHASSGAPLLFPHSRTGRLPLISNKFLLRTLKTSAVCRFVPFTKSKNLTLRAEVSAGNKKDPERPLALPVTLRELLQKANVSPASINGDANVLIRGIQHDSRLVQAGDAFICCRGFSTDGHIYAADAARNGAVAIISTDPISAEGFPLTFVHVKDTNAILSALSAAFYGNPSHKLTVVGITGTNGKTTTAYLVKSILETMNLKTGLLGTIAHDIGSGSIISASNTTPDALSLQFYLASMLANNAKACVMEVSSHALAQGRCIALDFDLAVFTNLTRDHMDFHKTEERYKESKAILFAMMVDPLRHRKIVNADDPHAPYFLEQGNPSVPVLKFSLNNRDADVYASNVVLSLFKTQFIAHTNAGSMRITSNLLGKHNVYNILAAIAVGIAANIPLSVIAAGVEAVDVVPGRCEVLKQGQNFVVLVDYAHTPDALARLLDTVRDCGAERVITVIGCGGDRDKGKRPIMAKIAAEKSEICILTSDNPRTEDPWSIINEMLTGIGMTLEDHLEQDTRNGILMLDPAQRLIICEDRRKAIKLAISKGKEGDAVIVAGKGHENYQILGNRKEHFDDREECQRALQDLITNAYHASQE